MIKNIRKNLTKAVAIALTIAIAFTGCGNSNTFAKVNGESISKEKYQEYLDFSIANAELTYGKEMLDQEIMEGQTGRDIIEEQAKDGLTSKEAVLQAAKKEKIEVKDSEVEKDLKKLKENKGFDELLKAAKLDEKSFKEILKEDIIISKFTEKIMEDKKPTEEEMKKFFEENQANLETVTASHILVESEEEANDISNQIKEGKNFEDFVEKSTDEASKAMQGSVGEFPREGKMVEEFSAAAFALEPGQISDPVKSEFGYHIIKSDGKKIGYDQVKEDISSIIQSNEAKEEIQKIIDDAKIEILMKEEKDTKDTKENKKTDGNTEKKDSNDKTDSEESKGTEKTEEKK